MDVVVDLFDLIRFKNKNKNLFSKKKISVFFVYLFIKKII